MYKRQSVRERQYGEKKLTWIAVMDIKLKIISEKVRGVVWRNHYFSGMIR